MRIPTTTPSSLVLATLVCVAIAGLFAVETHAMQAEPVAPLPPIPEQARQPFQFVPPGWNILQRVFGDLNNDGRNDIAIVIAKANEAPSGSPRGLIIAYQVPGFGYELAEINWNAVMPSGSGGATIGDAFADLRIGNQTVLIDHFGAATGRWGLSQRYKLAGDEFELVEQSNSGYDPAQSLGYAFDMDLSSGRSSLQEWHKPHKRPVTHKFYSLRALELKEAPQAFPPAEAYGDAIYLKLSTSVVVGANRWRGPKDCSGAVAAATANGRLYVITTVTDDSVTPEDQVRLVDTSGQEVAPIDTTRGALPHGYVQQSIYPLSALQQVERSAEDKIVPELLGSVEIVDYDKTGELHCVVSSSDGGRKYPADWRLVSFRGLPKLSDLGKTWQLRSFASARR